MPHASAPPPEPRRRRRLRAVALALGALAAGYGAGLAALSRPPVRAALRERISTTLRGRLGEVQLGDEVHVDPLFRVTFGPVVVPGARAGDPPVVRIERVKVRARLLPLLSGRAEPASIRLYGARIEAGPEGRALAELAARLRRSPHRRPASAGLDRSEDDPGSATSDPVLHVRGLVVALAVARRPFELGPFDASLRRERSPGEERIALDLHLPGGGRGALDVVRAARSLRGTLRLSDVGPEVVPAALQDLPATVARGRIALEAEAEGTADLSRAEVRVRGGATDLYVAGARAAVEPVGPLSVAGSAVIGWDGARRALTLRSGQVELLDAVPVAVEGEARLGPGVPFRLAVRAAGVDFAAAVRALPPSLAPPLAAPRPAGTLDAHLALAGPLLAPAAWTVDAGLDLTRLREAARRAPPVALRAPFVHHPELDGGQEGPALLVGPANPDFVPIAELPVHVVRAVTTAEDAGFFGHPGFEFEELKNAFAQAAQAGHLVRGGSTITQQLAKNLWLSREKTLARKAREAVVTIALEATVPKQRLLEIYLNLAEWGPGIWGIGPAARHWFGKDARALSPREAAFLASVIPNPVRYHVMWARGATTEQWDQRVNELLLKMNTQGALSDDDLVAAMAEPIVFERPTAAIAAP